MADWETALDALVRTRHRSLIGYAYLLSGCTREAEDLVQDALVKIYARKHLPAADDAEAYVRRAILTIYLDVSVALDSLTPRQRACVVLRYFEDLTVPRIAEELGCAPGTVKRHLFDAHAVLQERLGPLRDSDDEAGPAVNLPARDFRPPERPHTPTTPADPRSTR